MSVNTVGTSYVYEKTMKMDIVPGQFDDASEDDDLFYSSNLKLNDEFDHMTLEDDFGQFLDSKDEYLKDDFFENSKDARKLNYQPLDKVLSRFENKIKVSAYEYSGMNISKPSSKVKDKSDRATAEQVMDPRTRLILFKLLSRGTICEINGVLSTGKEANVYHSLTPDGSQRAVKIYKTSILIFKDRERYVAGEFRFRRGFCKGNPRKMVATWAEKEMRNLTRLSNANVRCPIPFMLKGHVLIMEFIGHNDIPAPLLKNVTLSETKYRELYLECIHMMRDMYHRAKLIHADLSEYNILYHNGGLVFIDVSQSVEHDHQNALIFLRKDCQNINEFFRRKGVASMNLKELFNFVTDVTIDEDNIDQYLDTVMKIAAKRSHSHKADEDFDRKEEEIFKNSYIPRTLYEVKNVTKDLEDAKHGRTDDVLYRTVTGINVSLSGVQEIPALLQIENFNEEDGESVVEAEAKVKGDTHKNVAYSRKNMTKEEWKNHKKEVKEENRIKRKEKIPKHIKKRKDKLPHAKRRK